MRKNIYILGSFVSLFACHDGDKGKDQVNKTINVSAYQKSSVDKKDTSSVEYEPNDRLDSINVVALKEDYSKGPIMFYNIDDTPWKTIEITDDFSDSAIAPYALKPEDRILVFRVIGRKNNAYSIVVNEERNIIKYLKPNIAYFNYETWQQHIIKAFSVDFSPRKNHLKAAPLDTARSLPFDKEQFYHPVEIRGDWLKVKDDNNNVGWIKWRNRKGELLIQIFYEA